MRFKIAQILSVFFIALTLVCTQRASIAQSQGLSPAWLPKSDAQMKNLKKTVSNQVTELAKNNYFPTSLTATYIDAVMNSLNQNNGQALIIAHDGMRWTKFTYILGDDNSIKATAKNYAYDFSEMFKESKIGRSEWVNLIHQLNTLGCAVAVADGSIKYSYDFKEGRFVIQRTTYQSN